MIHDMRIQLFLLSLQYDTICMIHDISWTITTSTRFPGSLRVSLRLRVGDELRCINGTSVAALEHRSMALELAKRPLTLQIHRPSSKSVAWMKWVWVNTYRYITIVGWTSIYQLFWCSPGVQGFDTLPNAFGVSWRVWIALWLWLTVPHGIDGP